MNIGSIKASLKLADTALPVYFDFCECVPTSINSWRGNYAEPAIGWSPSGYSGNGKPPTVAQFLDELEMATSGRLYSGWHGGAFSYTDNNQLYVDNNGDSTSTKIIDIEVCENKIILHTAKAFWATREVLSYLEQLAFDIETAPRCGWLRDEPEGAMFVILSNTFVWEVATRLRGIMDELVS